MLSYKLPIGGALPQYYQRIGFVILIVLLTMLSALTYSATHLSIFQDPRKEDAE